MKRHNGMRPHDIPILIFIALYSDGDFKLMDLHSSLKISLSEISESLKRSRVARLIGTNKRVYRSALLDFICIGLRYVFPVEPGAIVRGFGTSHSAPPLKELIVSSDEQYVWNSVDGTMKGMDIRPLYPDIPGVCQEYPELYEVLALIDALRIGKAREVNLAKRLLKERLLKNA